MITNPLLKGVIAATTLCTASFALAADAKDVLASFHAALAGGDKSAALALMAPDVTIYESGYIERSRDAYASHHLAEDMAFARTSVRKVLKQSERTDGNNAFILAETETTGTSQGKPVHAFGTETAVLQKNGDAWSIVHVHWSSRKAK